MRNKFILSVLIMVALSGQAFGAWNAAKPTDSEKLKDTPALIRANWDAIATGTDAALQITNAKVANSAAIVDTKLATISTAGKVSGAALTSLSSVPSGAGALPLVNGGTGATTRQAALDALLDTQTLASGKALISNGTNGSWGYPASLTIGSATTGDLLYYNGTAWVRLAPGTDAYPLTSTGAGSAPAYEQVSLTAGVTGVLPIANGGTGQDTAQEAIDALLPAQGSANGKFLTSNGTNASWGTPNNGIILTAGTYLVGNYPLYNTQVINSATYKKMVEMSCPYTGGLRISWKADISGITGYARIYINGVAVGAEILFNSGMKTNTTDVAGLNAGDLIQIYAKENSGQTFYLYDLSLNSAEIVASAPKNRTYYGTGAPAGNLGLVIGDVYYRTDGSTSTSLYIKTAGSTWTAI